MKVLVAACLLVISTTTWAESERELTISAGANLGFYSVKDSVGDTESQSEFIPISLRLEYAMTRIDRLVLGWRYVDITFAAERGGASIGATVEGQQLEAQWKHQWRLTRDFKPWFGGGLRLNQLEVKDRFTVDNDGFLLSSYGSQDDSSVALLLSVSTEWELADSWLIDTEVSYDQPFGDGFQGLGLTASIKRRF